MSFNDWSKRCLFSKVTGFQSRILLQQISQQVHANWKQWEWIYNQLINTVIVLLINKVIASSKLKWDRIKGFISFKYKIYSKYSTNNKLYLNKIIGVNSFKLKPHKSIKCTIIPLTLTTAILKFFRFPHQVCWSTSDSSLEEIHYPLEAPKFVPCWCPSDGWCSVSEFLFDLSRLRARHYRSIRF